MFGREKAATATTGGSVLFKDDEYFNPMALGFNFAVKDLPEDVATIKVEQNFLKRNEDGTMSFDSSEIPLFKCSQLPNSFTKLVVSNQQIDERVFDDFLCPDIDHIELRGSFYETDFRYISIRLFPCSEECHPDWEQLIEQNFDLVMIDSRPDMNDFNMETIVKHFLRDDVFLQIDNKISQNLNIYIQKNSLFLDDSLFNRMAKLFQIIDIFQVTDRVYYSSTYNENDFLRDAYGSFYIRISQESLTYYRQVYSFVECIGDIGGLTDFILKVGAFLTSFFVGNLYFGELINNVFQIQEYNIDHSTLDKTDKRKRSFAKRRSSHQNTITQSNFKENPLFTDDLDNENKVMDTDADKKTERKLLSQESLPNLDLQRHRSDAPTYHSQRTVNNVLSTSMAIDRRKTIKSLTLQSLFTDQFTKETVYDILFQKLINRERLTHNLVRTCKFMIKCLPCRKKKNIRKLVKDKGLNKDYYYFTKGVDKVNKQLDVFSFLKNAAMQQVYFSTIFNRNEQLLVDMQKKLVIDSDTTDSTSGEDADFHISMYMSENMQDRKQKHLRSRTKTAINYLKENQDLSQVQLRIICGLLSRNPNQFELETEKDKFKQLLNHQSIAKKHQSGSTIKSVFKHQKAGLKRSLTSNQQQNQNDKRKLEPKSSFVLANRISKTNMQVDKVVDFNLPVITKGATQSFNLKTDKTNKVEDLKLSSSSASWDDKDSGSSNLGSANNQVDEFKTPKNDAKTRQTENAMQRLTHDGDQLSELKEHSEENESNSQKPNEHNHNRIQTTSKMIDSDYEEEEMDNKVVSNQDDLVLEVIDSEQKSFK